MLALMSDKGYDQPNYTQIPNVFLDEQMPKITSMAELKIALAVMRQTFGWHKGEDKISVSQLEELTGLSRPSVNEGIKAALAHRLIERRKQGNSFVYYLNVKNLDSKESEPEIVKNLNQSVVKNLNPQKKDTKERKETPTGSSENARTSTENQELTDRLYDKLKDEYGIRLTKQRYGFHLGKFRDILNIDEATPEEVERVLAHMVKNYPNAPKIHAVDALADVRLGRDDGTAWDKPAPWEEANQKREGVHPQSEEADDMKRNKPRQVRWYLTFFECNAEEVEKLIADGLPHEEITRKLKRKETA